ncbi:MAG: tetratricopeptide repeat protein [Deltaproteobacteria bacterium]|nr:MAG: tetratricopeptide repeat protein [Deltaproteobacteria bacterium]
MGLLSWLFPSDEDRVKRAQALVDKGRFADARLEVMDIELPEAVAIVDACERELAELNLKEAISWGQANDERRVDMHMELATNFQKPGMEERFREVRRILREQRQARREADRRAREEKEARMLSVDPFGMSGGGSLLEPVPGFGNLEEDAEERAQRLALIIENYPAELRNSVEGLGSEFSQALLDLEDGRPDLALPTLLGMPDDRSLVRWERARAAYALGDAKAAAREVRAFSEQAGGHFAMGRMHSGVFLAQLTAEAGDLPAAIRILRTLRAQDPKVGGVLLAQLLEATGELAEADALLREQIKAFPKAMQLYQLLARVRVRGGDRRAAIQALEASQVHQCSSGRCGTVPVQPEMLRDLAILYFEEGIEAQRALQLVREAEQMGLQPSWETAYLVALAAKSEGHPQAFELAQSLREQTPEGPLRDKLDEHLLPAA